MKSLAMASSPLSATANVQCAAKVKSPRTRQWSIADQLDKPCVIRTDHVSARDVHQIRALFLSSGVKACELCRRADEPSTERPAFLASAETAADVAAASVNSRHEQRIAGQLWSEAIDSLQTKTQDLHKSFNDHKVPSLRDTVERLRRLAGEELTSEVQTIADGDLSIGNWMVQDGAGINVRTQCIYLFTILIRIPCYTIQITFGTKSKHPLTMNLIELSPEDAASFTVSQLFSVRLP